MVNITGINLNSRNKWSYPNLRTATRPVIHVSDKQPGTSTSSDHPIMYFECNIESKDIDSV